MVNPEEFDLIMERDNEGPYYSIGSLPIVSIMYVFINHPKLVQLESYLLRDPVGIGMLVLRILAFRSIPYSQQ